MQAGAKRATASLASIKAAAGGVDTALSGISKAGATLAGLAGTIGLGLILRQTLDTTRAFEALRSRLETVMGTALRGEQAFAALQKMAASTPFQVQELVDAYIRLQAQGISPTESMMTSLGNTASAMGKSIVDASDALLGAIMGEFERLKAFGIKARIEGEMVAFTFGGVTTQVENNATAITGYLQKIGNTNFAGAMERQSKTLNGALSNLQDSAASLMDQVGQSGLSRELAELARQMSSTAGSGESMAKRLGQGLGFLIGSTSLLVSAFQVAANSIGIALGTILQGILALIGSAAKAYKSLIDTAADLLPERLAGGLRTGSEALAGMIGKTNEWISVAREFAGVSKDQVGTALLTLEERWEGLKERTMAGTAANAGATVSLDDLAKAAAEAAAKAAAAAAAAEAAAKAAKKFADRLKEIVDRANPASASARDLVDDINFLGDALAAKKISSDQYAVAIRGLVPEFKEAREWAFNFATGLFEAAKGYDRLTQAIANSPTVVPTPKPSPATIDAVETDWSLAADNFAQHLEQGTKAAFSAAIVSFANGSDDAIEQLGRSLLDVLLNAVAEWLAAALAAIAKQAAASAAVSVAGGASGTGGYGSAAAFVGPVQQGAGAMAGLSTAAWAAIGAVAVMAALVAVFKHQSDKAEAARYGTEVGVNVTNGVVTTDWNGKFAVSGQRAADAINALMTGLQEATGAFIQGTQWAAIQIRNDKGKFLVSVGNEVLGAFQSVQDAIMAAAKKMFLDGAAGLDPIFRSMIDNFKGDDPTKLLESLAAVRQIIDETSGFSEVQIALRDLPGQVNALTNQLVQMGVSIEDARAISGRYNVAQRQNLRDQITGHQATVAEQRAQFERESAIFNAELLLDRARIQTEIASLKAQTEAQQAEWNLATTEVEMHEAAINAYNLYLIAKNDQLDMEQQMAVNQVNFMGQVNAVAMGNLLAQIAALEEIGRQLDGIKLIRPDEFRPNGGGGGVGGGFSGGESDEERAAREAREEAERIAGEIAQVYDALRQHSIATGGWQGRMAALRDEMERLQELANGDARALQNVNNLFENQIELLEQEALSSLGIASVEITNQFQKLADTLKFLAERGAISEAQLRELGDSMFLSLADGLMQYVEDEDVRQQLAQLRFQMEIANYRLQFQLLREMGLLTQEQIDLVQYLLDNVQPPGEPPPPPPDPGGGGGGTGGGLRDEMERALIRALDRLRGALESYEAFQRDLQFGPLSGSTLQAQSAAAGAEYEALLARAQAGDLDAIEQLPDVARQYLDLAGQFMDPSSSGYQALRAAIMAQMGGIQGGIEGILANAPDAQAGVEIRLDTIADILQEALIWWQVALGPWNPYGVPGGPQSPQGVGASAGGLNDFASGNALRINSPQLDVVADGINGLRSEMQRELSSIRREVSRQTDRIDELQYRGAKNPKAVVYGGQGQAYAIEGVA